MGREDIHYRNTDKDGLFDERENPAGFNSRYGMIPRS
jgi:hypothetical protein